jgi:WD40 repeat protein
MAGLRNQLWQHPFVDVFKYVNIQDWRLAHKEGEVSEALDPISKRKVVKLAGSISAANYVQMPKTGSAMKTLGLTGKFMYVLFQVQPGKLFSMHFDFALATPRATRLFRLSVSNLYKANKLSSTLQLSCPTSHKWTVLVVSLPEVIRQWASEASSHQLKSVTLCACMIVRGVFASDILYSVKTLPKEMQLRVKEGEWSDSYDWIMLPLGEDQNALPEEIKQAPAKPKKRAPAETQRARPSPRKEAVEEAKADNPAEVIIEPALLEGLSLAPTEPFPDPISYLRRVLHISAKASLLASAASSYFSAYGEDFSAGTDEVVLYVSNCTIIAMNPATQAQEFMFAHSQPILSLSCRNGVLASADSQTVLIWNIKTRRSPVSLAPKFYIALTHLQLNDRGTQLAIVGLDEHSRVLVSVWSLLHINKRQGISLEAKQLSDFEVTQIKFSPFDEGRLVSCGKESVRFWRVKHKHLPGNSVVLNSYSRSCFTALEVTLVSSAKKVVVVSDGGCVFIINYHSREIETVRQIHSGAVLSLAGQGEFWVTGGQDCLVKVWNNDFGEAVLEAEHPAAVVGLVLSSSAAYCLTDNAVLGALDLDSSAYKTLVRSHTQGILASCVHRPSGYLVTVGEDRSIRLWNELLEQTYEFRSPADEPTAVSASPTADSFVVGFQSGTVRLFEMGSLLVLEEFTSHVTAVTLIRHSLDGKWAITVSEEGAFTLLDAHRKYIAIKHVLVDCPGAYSSAAFAPDSSEFATLGSYGNSIDFWDLRSLNVRHSVSLGAFVVQQVEYSANCFDLVALVHKETFVFAFFDSQRKLYREVVLPCAAQSFTISPNWLYIVSVHADALLRVWDYRGESHVQAFQGHSEAALSVEFGQDMKTIVTTAAADGVFVWLFKGDNAQQPLPITPGPAEVQEEAEVEAYVEEPEAAVSDMVEEYLRHAHLLEGPTKSEAGLRLSRIVGFTPHKQSCLVWAPSKGWFAYTCGVYVIVHFLKDEGTQHPLKHLDPVTCLSISPDSEILATASANSAMEGSGLVFLWSVATASVLSTLALHELGVKDLAFSPCGTYLASLGNEETEQTLAVWNAKTASMLAYSVLESSTHSLKWSPMEADAEFAAIGPSSLSFWRLNAALGLDFQPSSLPIRNEVSCGTYSPILKMAYFLFLGTVQGTVQVWEGRTNSFLHEFSALQGAVLSISCKSRRLVVGGESPYLLSWDWTKSLCKDKPETLLLESFAMNMWLEDPGDEGLVCTVGGTIWYINWLEKATVRIVSSHFAPISAVSAQDCVVSAAHDSSLRVWNPALTEQILQFMLPNLLCKTIDFHPQAPFIAAGFNDGSLRFFNTVIGKAGGKAFVFDSELSCVKFCQDGDTLLCGSSSGRISVVLVQSWEPLAVKVQDFGMAGAGVVGLDISPREPTRVLLASTNDGKTHVWEKKLTSDSLTHDRLVPDDSAEFNLIDFYRVLDADLAAARLAYDVKVRTTQDSLEAVSRFAPLEAKVYLTMVPALQYILMRNYAKHAVIRKIALNAFPLALALHPSGTRFAVSLSDRHVRIFDYESAAVEELDGEAQGTLAWVGDELVGSVGNALVKWSVTY